MPELCLMRQQSECPDQHAAELVAQSPENRMKGLDNLIVGEFGF
jgi:hypothetical protein